MIDLLITALKYYGGNPKGWRFPWCAAFLNFVLEENKLKGTGSLMARSALKIGKSVTKPEPGDIIVLWRTKKDSPWGHSGLYVYEDKDSYFVLGGNQDSRVKIKPYPKAQLLGFRRINAKKKLYKTP